jgi:DNA-binding CsgD family transcriptional regulator
MREVSVRMLHFQLDLARVAGVDEHMLTEGLPSVAMVDGKTPPWIDWEDFIEVAERLERSVGGPEGLGRAMRDALPVAYPELRAFTAVFVHPIPLFSFVMTRLMRTMYRHITTSEIERLGDDRVRWTQSIPEPYRASETFHRATCSLVEVFPRHLELPEAQVEESVITPRKAEFVARFPPPPSLADRGARAVSSAVNVLGEQLDAAFLAIADKLRSHPETNHHASDGAAAGDWADRLSLSRRQRDVFALLVQGRPNREIAASLGCSERNIEFHVGKILRAARVSSRAELLVKVLG